MEQYVPIEEIRVGDLIKQKCATGCRDYCAVDNCEGGVDRAAHVTSITKNPNSVFAIDFYYLRLADGQTAYGWTGTPIKKIT